MPRKSTSMKMPEKLHIGERVKAFRKAQQLSLSELSARTGISEATLSRVENDQTLMSAANLYVLSQALNVDMSAFFDSTGCPARSGIRSITRKGQGVSLETERYSAQVLCNDITNKKMNPAIDIVAGRTLEDVDGLHAHPGEEFLMVLDGCLHLHSEHYAPLLLEAEDSIYFDSSMKHAYVCAGDTPARILVIATIDATHLKDEGE
ncbi:XRE family transcriptional regulator [Pseudovibrio sp. Tun.PSC04-5.I4]|uniref:helix-turn-helix domain-containing protein n=1 Tax=Pseudovibrio sp. Tun.PSC04-5.I4 TaxID=1798213 RepID=UPI000B80D192|nr:XRE family transcriptional regulator [Pseudovibrio sp. Tun.PSC04-5.I4]